MAPVQHVLLADVGSIRISTGPLLPIRRTFNVSRNGQAQRPRRHKILDGLRHVCGNLVHNISAMLTLINLVASTVHAQLMILPGRQLDASDSRVALIYSAGSAEVALLPLHACVTCVQPIPETGR
jgi:hypothetical protein